MNNERGDRMEAYYVVSRCFIKNTVPGNTSFLKQKDLRFASMWLNFPQKKTSWYKLPEKLRIISHIVLKVCLEVGFLKKKKKTNQTTVSLCITMWSWLSWCLLCNAVQTGLKLIASRDYSHVLHTYLNLKN